MIVKPAVSAVRMEEELAQVSGVNIPPLLAEAITQAWVAAGCTQSLLSVDKESTELVSVVTRSAADVCPLPKATPLPQNAALYSRLLAEERRHRDAVFCLLGAQILRSAPDDVAALLMGGSARDARLLLVRLEAAQLELARQSIIKANSQRAKLSLDLSARNILREFEDPLSVLHDQGYVERLKDLAKIAKARGSPAQPQRAPSGAPAFKKGRAGGGSRARGARGGGRGTAQRIRRTAAWRANGGGNNNNNNNNNNNDNASDEFNSGFQQASSSSTAETGGNFNHHYSNQPAPMRQRRGGRGGGSFRGGFSQRR
mgnify:CR=1 FL=1